MSQFKSAQGASNSKLLLINVRIESKSHCAKFNEMLKQILNNGNTRAQNHKYSRERRNLQLLGNPELEIFFFSYFVFFIFIFCESEFLATATLAEQVDFLSQPGPDVSRRNDKSSPTRCDDTAPSAELSWLVVFF